MQIKVLLTTVKDFSLESGDSAYTMGIVDLLLECVELSYRPDSGGISLREDLHNAHGYQFLVQFGLVLSTLPKNQDTQYANSKVPSEENSASDGSRTSYNVGSQNFTSRGGDTSPPHLSPSLSRLLDVLVNLSQTVVRSSLLDWQRPQVHLAVVLDLCSCA